MEKENKKVSRKTFLAWGVGVSSLLSIPAILKFSGKKKKAGNTVKMLTQQGTLVEIDMANIPSKKKKIKSEDIPTWINKKN